MYFFPEDLYQFLSQKHCLWAFFLMTIQPGKCVSIKGQFPLSLFSFFQNNYFRGKCVTVVSRITLQCQTPFLLSLLNNTYWLPECNLHKIPEQRQLQQSWVTTFLHIMQHNEVNKGQILNSSNIKILYDQKFYLLLSYSLSICVTWETSKHARLG